MTTTTKTRTPRPTIEAAAEVEPTPITTKRPTLRRDLDETARILKEKKARVRKYTRNPARNAVGEPLPMPLRFTIALTTATRRHAAAVAAYDARFGAGASKKALASR